MTNVNCIDGRNPLRRLQEELDEAVIDAYGFSHDEDVSGSAPRAQPVYRRAGEGWAH